MRNQVETKVVVNTKGEAEKLADALLAESVETDVVLKRGEWTVFARYDWSSAAQVGRIISSFFTQGVE